MFSIFQSNKTDNSSVYSDAESMNLDDDESAADLIVSGDQGLTASPNLDEMDNEIAWDDEPMNHEVVLPTSFQDTHRVNYAGMDTSENDDDDDEDVIMMVVPAAVRKPRSARKPRVPRAPRGSAKKVSKKKQLKELVIPTHPMMTRSKKRLMRL